MTEERRVLIVESRFYPDIADELLKGAVAALDEARNGLADAGFQVQWHVSRGIGHGIAPDGLSLALDFLTEHLGLSPE